MLYLLPQLYPGQLKTVLVGHAHGTATEEGMSLSALYTQGTFRSICRSVRLPLSASEHINMNVKTSGDMCSSDCS